MLHSCVLVGIRCTQRVHTSRNFVTAGTQSTKVDCNYNNLLENVTLDATELHQISYGLGAKMNLFYFSKRS